MMATAQASTVRVAADPTNPGQYFACCGFLELADRLWSGAAGWFTDREFHVCATGNGPSRVETTLEFLVDTIAVARLVATDPLDETASPIRIESGFSLLLDWWKDTKQGGDRLKVWAGSMRSVRIARAMQGAITLIRYTNDIFDEGRVVYDVDEPTKKVEPFYFDARRGCNAKSVDVGFAPDAFGMTSIAYPAVEFLCLVGLQRFRPAPTSARRIFEFHTWREPLPPLCAAAAGWGGLAGAVDRSFRFEVGFRTDQRKHKAFLPATQLSRS